MGAERLGKLHAGDSSQSRCLCCSASFHPRSRSRRVAKVAHAVRVTTDGALHIDGVARRQSWSRAPIISDFVRKIPNEGAAPSVSTEVRLRLRRRRAVHRRATSASDPNAIRTSVTRRDAESDAEVFTVSLDTYLDRRTA